MGARKELLFSANPKMSRLDGMMSAHSDLPARFFHRNSLVTLPSR
jgi:hypothetical protein